MEVQESQVPLNSLAHTAVPNAEMATTKVRPNRRQVPCPGLSLLPANLCAKQQPAGWPTLSWLNLSRSLSQLPVKEERSLRCS